MEPTPSPAAVSQDDLPRGHHSLVGRDATSGQPFGEAPLDYPIRRRIHRQIPPATLAKIFNEAGYDEPVDPPSRLQNIIVVTLVFVVVFGLAVFL